jgi:hypothetical protein
MSKVLLVDTSLASLPIAQSLEAAGHEVHVVGSKPRDTLALLYQDRYFQLDYAHWAALGQHFLDGNFDALIPGCNDLSYDSCCRVAYDLSLPGYASPEASAQLNQKAAFRAVASRLGLPTPRVLSFMEASLTDGLVIVKPVDAFSGRGVSVVNPRSRDALSEACRHAQRTSPTGQFLIEEFVSGQLFSHSAFLKDQRVIQDVFVQEHCKASPFAVDTSWVDTEVAAPVKALIRESVEQLARCLHLRDGLFHTQFIAQGAEAWIVEPTLRCPGDLYSRLIELSLSMRYVENYWRPFVGQPPILTKPGVSNRVVRHTVTFAEAGSFHGLHFSDPFPVIEYYPLIRVGKPYGHAPQGRAGVLFLQFPTAEAQAAACEALLDRSALSYPKSTTKVFKGAAV